MKKLVTGLFALIALSAQAQHNQLLEPNFWKNSPDVAAIQAQIAKGNDPAEMNRMSFDPVVYAINGGVSNESIKFLLSQKGNEVNKLTHDGRTYIFWAAMKGNVEVMEYLISKGASMKIEDNHGYTPLNFAAVGGQQNTKVYDLCLSKGADLKKDLNHDGANALLLAVPADKDFALLNYFTSKGLDINSVDANGNTAFNYAARTGNIATLKGLIEKGVKYNDNAMILASQGSRGAANTLELYQFLEGLKIKPNALGKNGENALHAIVRRPKQEEVINYFMSKGVNINQADNDGNTPFMNAAASNNDAATITLLSAAVKNINQVNKKGVSALAMAVRNNSAEIVDLLIAKGADVNVVDANGDNLAAYLIQSYYPQRAEVFEAKLKTLEGKGVKVAAAQKNGNTIYHLALTKNDLALLKRVEGFKADVNGKDKEGLTVLHKAAMTAKDDEILKYLLSIGAKKEIATEFKETAYDLAGENEFLTKNNISIDFLK